MGLGIPEVAELCQGQGFQAASFMWKSHWFECFHFILFPNVFFNKKIIYLK